MQLLTQEYVKQALPVRACDAHKGCFGRVLVVAGSRRMCGAGLLCAKSALVAGAGLVYWALPASMQPAFAAALPEAITIPLPENATGELDASAWELFPDLCEAYRPSLLVVGPGMGASPLLPLLLQNASLPLMVDADALNALARIPAWHNHWPSERPAIFTPHAMEMARLLREPVATTEQARQAQVVTLAELTRGVSILKGKDTLVAAPEKETVSLFQNTTGSPALAKAGSGDVLSGLIAGLWAQLGTAEGFSVRSALKAATCAVYLHGRAGELAAQAQSTYGVLASDTLNFVPRAFLQVLEGA